MSKLQSTSPSHIVAVGASAGGLKALAQLLEAIPSDIGMAFVLVQHLDPLKKSLLPETLARTAQLPFIEVTDGTKITKDHIYAMPSESYMKIVDNTLRLTPRKKHTGLQYPIDSFFQSLAKHHGKDAIGVVLSGTANDGTVGIQAIKESGGKTFAQDDSAQFKDMPANAIASGSVDFILSPDAIARALIQISREITSVTSKKSKPENDNIDIILSLLKAKTGMDFRQYREASVNRRIQRRMFLNHIETVKEYHEFLKKNPSEAEALHKDILIHVTSFFRTPEQFEILKKTVFPTLFKNRSPKKPINIWIAGCATGEEAYSYAIAFQEFLGKKAKRPAIRILGTDISKDAIAQADKGIYKENVTEHVSPVRISKFFTKVKDGYEVKKSIRAMCEFAVADVTQNPPRLDNDLVSCRNLLIYLGEALQQKTLSMLSSALRPEGFLLLGKSEGLGKSAELFSPIDSKQRLYSKKATTTATDNLRKAVNAQVGMSAAPTHSQKITIPQSDDLNHNPRQEKIIKLKQAVELTQEYANEIISELDVMNEELQSTNEELTSSNEELQTTNEELETTQEELQTANEEMTTLNEELQTRNEEVTVGLDYAAAIIRTVRSPLLVLNRTLRIISANRSFYTTFKVDSDETENRFLYELGNNQWDIPKLRVLLEEILPKKHAIEDFVVEHEFETIGRRTMLLNARLLRQGPDKNPRILLSIEDITERKKAEKVLSRSEERLRFMAESMPQKVFTAKPNGDIDYFNPQWTEFTGLSFEQIKNWGWTKFVHPEDVDKTVKRWQHSIDSGVDFEFEHRFRRHDGVYHWHLSRSHALRNSEGKIIMWVGSNTNIEDVKHNKKRREELEALNTALKRQRGQLMALNRAQDEFISLASHQLRTPATGVKQYVGMLIEGYAGTVTSKQREFLEQASESNERQLQIIDDLLKVAQVDSGKMLLNTTSVDLVSLIEAVLEEQTSQFAERRQRILFRHKETSLSLRIDNEKMRMVLENLIDNAGKYTRPDKAITVTLTRVSGSAKIAIKDEGVGVAKKDLRLLFQKFSRVDNEMSMLVGGTGLGLYWVKKIIDFHAGSITVASIPGKGSTFTITIPIDINKKIV